MKELTMHEMEQVNGGIWQFMAGAIIGSFVSDAFRTLAGAAYRQDLRNGAAGAYPMYF